MTRKGMDPMKNEALFQWNELEPLCVLRLIVQKLWLAALAALTAMMLASMILTNFVTTSYTCSVTFAVTSRTGGVSVYANSNAAGEVAGVYAELLTGRLTSTVLQDVLGVNYNAELSAAQQGSTNLLKVTATSDSPQDALAVIQTIINRQGDLSAYISDSAVLTVLNTPIITRVTNSADRHNKICLLAGIAGGGAVIAALFLLSATSGTIQNRTAAQNNIDAKILVSIPHERSPLPWYKRRRGRTPLNITAPLTSFSFTEAIHRLALRLEHENGKGRKIFLFSSVSESEGKSTVAANTALSLAAKGAPVLLLDLDLRRPVQYRILGMNVPGNQDLGRLLAAGAEPQAILDAAVCRSNSSLHMLLSARAYPQLVEQLSSDRLRALLQLARQKFDYIILDTPPLGYFSDSEILSDLSDASVLVVRQDVAPAIAINDAVDALNAGRAECLGVVLNDMAHLSPGTSGYGYGYGYGKYGRYGKYSRYGKYDSGRNQSGSGPSNA